MPPPNPTPNQPGHFSRMYNWCKNTHTNTKILAGLGVTVASVFAYNLLFSDEEKRVKWESVVDAHPTPAAVTPATPGAATTLGTTAPGTIAPATSGSASASPGSTRKIMGNPIGEDGSIDDLAGEYSTISEKDIPEIGNVTIFNVGSKQRVDRFLYNLRANINLHYNLGRGYRTPPIEWLRYVAAHRMEDVVVDGKKKTVIKSFTDQNGVYIVSPDRFKGERMQELINLEKRMSGGWDKQKRRYR